MNILALDLSLTCTGFATDGRTGLLEPPAKLRGVERLAWYRTRLTALLDGVDLVVLENYAFGRPNQAHHLGELGGVVRLLLHDIGIPCVEIPPAALKKYATGAGNAGKSLVLVEAVKRLGYLGSDDNEADALWLCMMAHDRYGLIASPVPSRQRAALAGVQWPTLTTTEIAA